VQLVDELVLNDPGPHGWQLVAATAYCPATQATHCEAPRPLYEPALHVAHGKAGLLEKLPGWHTVQVEEAARLNEPVGQVWQATTVLLLNVPGRQTVQLLLLLVLKDPSEHV